MQVLWVYSSLSSLSELNHEGTREGGGGGGGGVGGGIITSLQTSSLWGSGGGGAQALWPSPEPSPREFAPG